MTIEAGRRIEIGCMGVYEVPDRKAPQNGIAQYLDPDRRIPPTAQSTLGCAGPLYERVVANHDPILVVPRPSFLPE